MGEATQIVAGATAAQGPSRRSERCHGEQIARFRAAAGLTQGELARLAGYSERLIRKAESGGNLSPASLADIAAALAKATDREVRVADLKASPIDLTRAILASFFELSPTFPEDIEHLLSDDFELRCSINPHKSPLQGAWQKGASLRRWHQRLLQDVPTTANKPLEYDVVGAGDVVLVWGQVESTPHASRVQQPGASEPGETSAVALRFQFEACQLVGLDAIVTSKKTNSAPTGIRTVERTTAS